MDSFYWGLQAPHNPYVFHDGVHALGRLSTAASHFILLTLTTDNVVFADVLTAAVKKRFMVFQSKSNLTIYRETLLPYMWQM